MSEILATSPALPDESPTVEGRLADLMADEAVRVGDYLLSHQDRDKVVAALRAIAATQEQRGEDVDAIAVAHCQNWGCGPDIAGVVADAIRKDRKRRDFGNALASLCWKFLFDGMTCCRS